MTLGSLCNIQYFLICYDIIVLKRGFQLIRYVRFTIIMTGALVDGKNRCQKGVFF